MRDKTIAQRWIFLFIKTFDGEGIWFIVSQLTGTELII